MEPTGNRRLWTVGSSPVLSPDLSLRALSLSLSLSLSLFLVHYLTVSRCGERRRKRNRIREIMKEEEVIEMCVTEDKKKEREV
jgi:hypothetical protein